MNSPERIKKISDSSKKMWKRWKESDIQMYRYMIESLKSKNIHHKNYSMNTIEYKMALILDELNLCWKFEKIFHFETRSYIPDFFVESNNLIVECYGDYWHANPKLFEPCKLLNENITAEMKWKYDLEKKEMFESGGYKFLYFWESDIHSGTEKIKENIKNATIY
jgi:very-short-patch-repair endonuclease